MDTIIITGSEGFFASRFIDFYKEQYNIIGLSRSDMDITDEKKTVETILKYKPDYLVHAAAVSDTGACEKNPELSYEINVKGSINIAKGCAASKTKLIYLSSDQVYNGNSEAGPYAEDCIVSPENVYGRNKLEAEKEIAEIIEGAVGLRLTWLFSFPERQKKTSSNIVWNIVRAAMKNEHIKIPVNEHRGITYVYDLIKNFNKILNLPGGRYNAGSENNLTTYAVAETVFKEMGLNYRLPELLIRDSDRYKDKKRDLRINNLKLRNYGITFPDTEEAVAQCIKDFSYKVI